MEQSPSCKSFSSFSCGCILYAIHPTVYQVSLLIELFVLQETQQKVLGPIFRRPWPLITPKKPGLNSLHERFNFLYTDSKVGKAARQNLLALLEADNTMIVINLGLSGAGKTHMITQLAQRGERWVLLYECGSSNARLIGLAIETRRRNNPRGSLVDYENFASELKLVMLHFQLATAFALLQLLKHGELKEPGQFLRYLENGGQEDIERTFTVLRQDLADLETAWRMKKIVFREISKLVKLPIIEVWDEAGVLTQWAAGMVPFSNHPDNPKTAFNPATRSLENAGSAFTVACRIARDTSDARTIFCGAALRLSNVGADISKDLLKPVKTTSDPSVPRVLEPWDENAVQANLEEDLELDGVPKDVLETISYTLQGRARLSSTFKARLFDAAAAEGKTNPSPDDIKRLLLRY